MNPYLLPLVALLALVAAVALPIASERAQRTQLAFELHDLAARGRALGGTVSGHEVDLLVASVNLPELYRIRDNYAELVTVAERSAA